MNRSGSCVNFNLRRSSWLTLFGIFILIIQWALLINFPHLCTYRNGWVMSSILTILYLVGLLLHQLRPGSLLARYPHEEFFPLVLSMVVSFIAMGALNDALYAADTGRLTIYDGLMTIGGLMPVSDSSGYLSGMQTFIHFGELDNWSLFKPLSILWAALLYDLSGEDMVWFLRISVFLFSVAAIYLGLVSKRHFGSLFSLILIWGISLYFIYFHGTFLTENFTAPFALLAMAFLLEGWQSRRQTSFLSGIICLSLAFVMRPGAMFFVPVLILGTGFHFSSGRRFSLRMPILASVIYASIVGLSYLQPQMLKNPFRQVSNAAGQLYQIHTNAPSWSVYLTLPYPDTLKHLDDIADAKTAFINREIKKDPVRFVSNYMAIMIRAFPRPETWVFSFAYQLPGWFRWGFLFLFLLTPWIRNRKDPVQLLFLLLCLNLIGALLSIPVMEELRTRLMMVTMPLHIMVFVLGLSNAFCLVSRIWPPGKLYNLEYTSEPANIKSDQLTIICSMWLLGMVIFGPVIFDKVRKIEKPELPKGIMRTFRGYSKIMVDLLHTPRALYDLDHDFKVIDPYVIPKSKYFSNMPDTSSGLEGSFFIANAVSCVGKPNARFEKSLLVIPEELMTDRRVALSRYVLFRIRDGDFTDLLQYTSIADSVLWAQ